VTLVLVAGMVEPARMVARRAAEVCKVEKRVAKSAVEGAEAVEVTEAREVEADWTAEAQGCAIHDVRPVQPCRSQQLPF